MNDLPCVLPALGYHAIDDSVWETICKRKSADPNIARRERRRRTMTVGQLETLKAQEDVREDGELHFEIC